jgi:hypothetical protein
MPLDSTGAPAPRPLTQWVEHLKRRKIAGRKARGALKRQRAITKQRLARAERLLSHVIEDADIVGQGTAPGTYGDYPVIYLLVALHSADFNNLAIFGAELEDGEDTHDAEPPIDEATLGRTERVMQPIEESRDDAEPSLGATQMHDQRRWHEGPVTDLELDRADDESNGDDEQRDYPAAKDETIIEQARSRFAAATGSKVVAWPSRDPLTGKAGAWLLQRRAGGAK